MEYNPIWSDETGRDSTYELDLDQQFELDDSAAYWLIYLVGDPMTVEQLLSEPERQFFIKADVAGTVYDTSAIVDFEFDNSLAEEFTLGTTTLSTLNIRLRTNNIIPPNARIAPQLAMAYRDEQVTDWVALGEWYVDSRKEQNGVWMFECLDKLVFADVPYIPSLVYPTTQQAVWNEICGRLGYVSDDTVTISPYPVPVAPTGYTMRQVMGFIAASNAASVTMRRDGRVGFRRFNVSELPARTLTTADYVRATPTNPVKSYSRVVIVYDIEDGLAYEAGTGTEDQTLYIDNPLGTQQMANDILAKIGGLSYLPVDIDAKGNPLIEPGEMVELVTRKDESYQTYVLSSVHTFKGGLTSKLSARSTSEQQSEFKVEGSLTQQVNRLTQSAVRQGKLYYGVTIDKDRGINIERSDRKAEVRFNADELRFQANGQDKIYFDVAKGEYVIDGRIIMRGGTIEWEDINGPDIGNVDGLPERLTKISSTGIYTGTIETNQLIAGSSKIGTALIENLVVGSNVTMGSNATISWDNVTGSKPPSNADNTTSVIGANRLTYISQTGIYTGTLTAQQINVSGINASNITTGTMSAARIDGGELNGISLNINNNFRVTSTGQLTATGATISGTINATGGTFSGTISGGTFQGSTFQTSSGSTRVELTSSGLFSYSSGSLDGVTIRPGDGDIKFYRSGVMRGSIYGSLNAMYVQPASLQSLYVGGSGQNTYTVGSWYIQNSLFIDQSGTNIRCNTSSSASSGSATLPSSPVGFIRVVINGTTRSIPYYG